MKPGERVRALERLRYGAVEPVAQAGDLGTVGDTIAKAGKVFVEWDSHPHVQYPTAIASLEYAEDRPGVRHSVSPLDKRLRQLGEHISDVTGIAPKYAALLPAAALLFATTGGGKVTIEVDGENVIVDREKATALAAMRFFDASRSILPTSRRRAKALGKPKKHTKKGPP